jgi:hypothetical protein
MKIQFLETRLLAVHNGPRHTDVREFAKNEIVKVNILDEYKWDVTMQFEDGVVAQMVPKEWFVQVSQLPLDVIDEQVVNEQLKKELLELIDQLDDVAWSAGSESGQGVCDQGSYKAEKAANDKRKAIRKQLEDKINSLK